MIGFRARTHRSGRTYYYFDAGNGPEIPLGADYVLAVAKWADLSRQPVDVVTTFLDLADRYERDVIPEKAKSTQESNRSDLKHLRAFFGDPPAPLDAIRPTHIHALMKWKKHQPTTAGRLKRVFSHMFNKAREWGYTDAPNPCAGIKALPIKNRRSVYTTDAVYAAVWQAASAPLRDAMDLAYLAGQRPGDTLKMTERDIQDGHLCVGQNKKGGARLRIKIEGGLAELLARIAARKAGYKVWCASLTVNTRGMPLTKQMLRKAVAKARIDAAAAHPEMAEDIRNMWFRDLRAKSASDIADARSERDAADLMGHENINTTRKHYLPRGRLTGPTR